MNKKNTCFSPLKQVKNFTVHYRKVLLRQTLSVTVVYGTVLIISFMSVSLFSGCAGLKSKNTFECNKKALQYAYKIKNLNRDLLSCRGIGWLRISDGEKKEKFRIAFAVSMPDRIRLTLMISGLPVETIIANGKKIIFLSHTKKHKLYKIDSPNPSLAGIISIPVKVQDIIALLSGRIPLRQFDCACFANQNKHRENQNKAKKTTLILSRQWSNILQKITWNTDDHTNKYSLVDKNNHLIYVVYFANFTKYGQFIIPFALNITDSMGRNLKLEITDYKANIPVKKSVFSLTESG